MSNVKVVDDSNFETEVLQSDLPVLVDFSAVWCGPCQRQHPEVEKFADRNAGKVKVCTIDIDDAPNVTSQFSIKGVPSLLLFHNGKKLGYRVGLTSAAALDVFLSENISA